MPILFGLEEGKNGVVGILVAVLFLRSTRTVLQTLLA